MSNDSRQVPTPEKIDPTHICHVCDYNFVEQVFHQFQTELSLEESSNDPDLCQPNNSTKDKKDNHGMDKGLSLVNVLILEHFKTALCRMKRQKRLRWWLMMVHI